jgi:simple sugar transport system permease protein/ribose transport system permease protein
MSRRMVLFLRRRTEVGVALVALLLIIGFNSTSDGIWLSKANMREVLRVTSVLAIMAFGEALVITTGEIDISVGAIFGVVGLTYIALAPDFGVPLAILTALAAGLAIGALNGFVTTYFRIPSLVVTLGSLFIFRGLMVYATEKTLYYAADKEMRANSVYRLFGDSRIGDYSVAVFWGVAALLVLHYVLFLTPIGNRLLAVGGDLESARSRGLNITYIKWGAFIACGFCAGLAGTLEASNLGYTDADFGYQRELEAIAAAVLGGCVLAGGRSSMIGTFIGAFILTGIESYLVIKTISPHWYVLLLGLIIVLVSLADRALTHLLTKLIAQEV